MRPRGRRKRNPEQVVLTGSLWEDVGEAHCARCHAQRRLYRPLLQPELRVCAPCTQVFALSSIPNTDRDETVFALAHDEILN